MNIRFALVAVLLAALPALAQTAPQKKTDTAKEADIRRLLEVSGGKKAGDQLIGIMMQQLKPLLEQAIPQDERGKKILATFLEKCEARFRAADLAEQVIPIYDKYLSAEDIKGLIQFYESPLGQRATQALPKITQEAATTGQQLGQKVVQDVLQEMQEQYPELKQGQKPAPDKP